MSTVTNCVEAAVEMASIVETIRNGSIIAVIVEEDGPLGSASKESIVDAADTGITAETIEKDEVMGVLDIENTTNDISGVSIDVAVGRDNPMGYTGEGNIIVAEEARVTNGTTAEESIVIVVEADHTVKIVEDGIVISLEADYAVETPAKEKAVASVGADNSLDTTGNYQFVFHVEENDTIETTDVIEGDHVMEVDNAFVSATPITPTGDNDLTGFELQPNKRRRKKSMVWEHFTVETTGPGHSRACCNLCKKPFTYVTGSKLADTSHLKRHISLGICPVSRQMKQLSPYTPSPKIVASESATDPPNGVIN
ncbi:hypothetical protein MLD38_030660 [Melastoma candidum]|uniref:Uncharacterized protein n=1 Tax=Melastoma candidum TaxID=119954 RepID=A0ACB9MQW9_9MYRT|nr:hypothetical protein MLD38_030660 [Melastoma candidum]